MKINIQETGQRKALQYIVLSYQKSCTCEGFAQRSSCATHNLKSQPVMLVYDVAFRIRWLRKSHITARFRAEVLYLLLCVYLGKRHRKGSSSSESGSDESDENPQKGTHWILVDL